MSEHADIARLRLAEAADALENAATYAAQADRRNEGRALAAHSRLVAVAGVHATLALVDQIADALEADAPTDPEPEPPDPMEPASLWIPITHDTVWAKGDLVALVGADAPVGHVISASTDSFSDTVLRVQWTLHPQRRPA